MNGLNKVQFIGNLGQDPSIIVFDNGGKKAEFSIATQDGYKGQDGQWVKTTDWHSCFATGKIAETIARYFKKGMRVYVEGKLKTRKWQDESGKTRYKTEVKVTEFMFLNGRAEGTAEQAVQADDYSNYNNPTDEKADDLPF